MKKLTILILFIFAIAVWVGFSSTALYAQGKDGANLYKIHCGKCHAQGGNIINRALPVTGSATMKSLDVFTAYNRKPLKADGSKGGMPAFPKDKISDEEMKLIYEYALTLPGTKK